MYSCEICNSAGARGNRDIQSQGIELHDKSFMFLTAIFKQYTDPVGAGLLANAI